MRVLLIEDDHGLSRELGDFLEYVKGWTILRAYRPQEALEALSESVNTIAVVVLDIMMPPDETIDEKKSDYGQDTGILLLDKLEPKTKGIVPIVILSARQDLGYLKEQGRVQEYLQKTLTPEEIGESVLECVETFRKLKTTGQRGA